MINTIKENFNRALYALIFSIITIGTLSFLSFETPYGLFLAGSFGSSMVLLFGYPESPFAQPKNVFFGHLVTSIVGVIICAVSYDFLLNPIIFGSIIIIIYAVILNRFILKKNYPSNWKS